MPELRIRIQRSILKRKLFQKEKKKIYLNQT